MPYVYRRKLKDGSPNRPYSIQYKDYRGIRRTAMGTTSKSETEKLARQIQIDQDLIRKGLRPPPRESDKLRPFREVAKEYRTWGESQGGRGGNGWNRTHRRMRAYFLKRWKEVLRLEWLSDLVGILHKVETALRKLKVEGKSGKTLQNYSDGLAAFCDLCCARGYLDQDPLKGLAPFDKTPQTRRRAMTWEEVGRLLKSCSPRMRLTYRVAIFTGLRTGELRSLRVSHLDLGREGLLLDPSWTKNRKAGLQPVPSALLAQLSEASKGKPPDAPLLYVPSHPARVRDEDLKRAGIPKVTQEGKVDFHALRVAYVTFVLKAGATRTRKCKSLPGTPLRN